MKESHHNDEQIAEALLAVQSGENLVALSKRLGISVGNIYNWRRAVDAHMPAEMNSLLTLNKENEMLGKFMAQNRNDLKYSSQTLASNYQQKGIL